MPMRRTPSSAGQLTGNVTTPVSPAPMTLATAPSPSTVHAPSVPASGPAVRRIHRSPGKAGAPPSTGAHRTTTRARSPAGGGLPGGTGSAPRLATCTITSAAAPATTSSCGTRRSKATPSTCSSVPTGGRRTTSLMSGESRSTGAGAEVWNDGAARAGRLPSSSGVARMTSRASSGAAASSRRSYTPRVHIAARSELVTGSTARSTTGELGSPSPNGVHVVPPSDERNTPASVPT